jgi:hypothetical protein
MRKILSAAKFILLSVVALLVVAVAAILALRAYRQHVTAQALAIQVRFEDLNAVRGNWPTEFLQFAA